MKKYLVLYRSSTSSEELMSSATPEQMKAGMEAWQKWAAEVGDGMAEWGAPTASGKSVTPNGVSAGESRVTGYSILQAESEDDAVRLVRDHPHLQTPGESSVEVLELIPVPGM